MSRSLGSLGQRYLIKSGTLGALAQVKLVTMRRRAPLFRVEQSMGQIHPQQPPGTLQNAGQKFIAQSICAAQSEAARSKWGMRLREARLSHFDTHRIWTMISERLWASGRHDNYLFTMWKVLFDPSSPFTLNLAMFTREGYTNQIYNHIASEQPKGFKSLKSIRVSHNFTGCFLGDIGQLCPDLETLEVVDVSEDVSMDDEDLLDFLHEQGKNEHFVHLDMSQCGRGRISGKTHLSLGLLPNLQRLDVLVDQFQGHLGLEAIPSATLKKLNLHLSDLSPHETIKSALALIPDVFPGLEEVNVLNLNGDWISSDNPEAVYSLYLPELRALGQKIRRIDIRLCGELAPLYEALPALVSLELYDPKWRLKIEAGEGFAHLSQVHLVKPSFSLDLAMIQNVLENCRGLTSVLFFGSEVVNVNHASLLAVFRKESNAHLRSKLERFSLASLDEAINLDWDTVVALLEVCRGLKCIDNLYSWNVPPNQCRVLEIGGRTFYTIKD
eukprot:maker-scaffold60_size442463-snap-gene-3.21 protein:Tk12081 transcript:maker-scaffold60_size442463-snap-gene-3.21-mRNA-1 annotation:"hypothetical protein EUGRSUZ_A02902"